MKGKGSKKYGGPEIMKVRYVGKQLEIQIKKPLEPQGGHEVPVPRTIFDTPVTVRRQICFPGKVGDLGKSSKRHIDIKTNTQNCNNITFDSVHANRDFVLVRRAPLPT